jgi:rhodanese-related sulfurtransferase
MNQIRTLRAGSLSAAMAALALAFSGMHAATAAGEPAASIPAASLVQPAQLAALLQDKSAVKPLLLQVGFRTLYDQAHIPGSDYAGPAGTDAGLEALRGRVGKLPKDAPIVIYCGCCPWSRCPNVAAAFDTLRDMGFSKVKVLYVAENFGTDWVDKGFPTATGK